MIIAGTGHRPDKLGGYGADVRARLQQLAEAAIEERNPGVVISGMALGWDTALAQAALACGVPLWAYIPFKGQELRWPRQAQMRYEAIMAKAAKVVVCSPGEYSVEKMQLRNIHMVDRATDILALWNGTPGGTANCLKYARHRKKPIHNLWDVWAA